MKPLICAALALTALTAQAADVVLELSVPPQKQGTVMAALFDKAEGFPRGKPLQAAMAQLADGKAVMKFAGLPPGEYAVSAFLDENGNTRLDTNVFGIPTELYGFSRNARNPMGPPPFADAAFRVEDANLQQTIDLK